MFPSELSAAIVSVATERSFSVASDTHYDAGNMEIQRWSNNVLHRLDFQLMQEGYVLVTVLTDTYPFAGRALRLAWRAIPFFPYVAKTKHRVLGKLEQPFLPEQLKTKIQEFLTHAA
jgi:hypothetical protein